MRKADLSLPYACYALQAVWLGDETRSLDVEMFCLVRESRSPDLEMYCLDIES